MITPGPGTYVSEKYIFPKAPSYGIRLKNVIDKIHRNDAPGPASYNVLSDILHKSGAHA